jgi:hypothetical protein
MTITEYIESQLPERQALMTALHNAILANDSSVIPEVEPMMGKDMILYKEKCYMKYGLAGVQKHMSLHCLPMYMNPALHTKFEALLPAAKFQKGCINFTKAEEFSLATAAALIADCAGVNIAEVLEARKKKKK